MEKVKRIERAVLNMSIAFLISKRGTCQRANVGAVITIQNRIVSTGYNGSILAHSCEDKCDITVGCIDAIHAEANAIAFAAKFGISISGCDLYCTHQPCYECAKLIIQSGVSNVFYSLPYRKNEGLALLNEHNISTTLIPYELIKDYIQV